MFSYIRKNKPSNFSFYQMSNTKIFLGFLAGVATGVAIGILLAPEKGDDTRKMLMGKARSLGSDVNEQLAPQLEKASELAKSLSETIKNTLTDYSNRFFRRNGQETAQVEEK